MQMSKLHVQLGVVTQIHVQLYHYFEWCHWSFSQLLTTQFAEGQQHVLARTEGLYALHRVSMLPFKQPSKLNFSVSGHLATNSFVLVAKGNF